MKNKIKPKVIISPRFCKLMSVFINVYAITLYPFIISKEPLPVITYNHEKIHLVQQRELWVVGFYILYVWYWLKAVAIGKTGRDAYYAIPFEKEAYENEKNLKYLKTRKPHAWKGFI
jgi:hypothetical protein